MVQHWIYSKSNELPLKLNTQKQTLFIPYLTLTLLAQLLSGLSSIYVIGVSV